MKVTLPSLERLVTLSGDDSEVSKHLQHNVQARPSQPEGEGDTEATVRVQGDRVALLAPGGPEEWGREICGWLLGRLGKGTTAGAAHAT